MTIFSSQSPLSIHIWVRKVLASSISLLDISKRERGERREGEDEGEAEEKGGRWVVPDDEVPVGACQQSEGTKSRRNELQYVLEDIFPQYLCQRVL